MKPLTIIAATLLTTILSMSVSAEIIHSDWESTGDKLTTTDTATGLEFLKLTETINMSVSQVTSMLGSKFIGWRFPSEGEVEAYLSHLYPAFDFNNHGIYSNNLSDGYTDQNDMLGQSNTYAYGLFKTDLGSFVISGSRLLSSTTYTIFNQRTHSAYTDSYKASIYGVFLVRDSAQGVVVGVHAPFVLSSIALLGLGLFRRKKAK